MIHISISLFHLSTKESNICTRNSVTSSWYNLETLFIICIDRLTAKTRIRNVWFVLIIIFKLCWNVVMGFVMIVLNSGLTLSRWRHVPYADSLSNIMIWLIVLISCTLINRFNSLLFKKYLQSLTNYELYIPYMSN